MSCVLQVLALYLPSALSSNLLHTLHVYRQKGASQACSHPGLHPPCSCYPTHVSTHGVITCTYTARLPPKGARLFKHFPTAGKGLPMYYPRTCRDHRVHECMVHAQLGLCSTTLPCSTLSYPIEPQPTSSYTRSSCHPTLSYTILRVTGYVLSEIQKSRHICTQEGTELIIHTTYVARYLTKIRTKGVCTW